MNTKHAETETSIERMNAALERLRTDTANLKTEMARRDNRLISTVLGAMLYRLSYLLFMNFSKKLLLTLIFNNTFHKRERKHHE